MLIDDRRTHSQRKAEERKQHGRRQHAQNPAVHMKQGGDIVCAPQQPDRTEEQHAQAERRRIEDDHACDLRRLHPGRRIEAHAHDAAGQRPEPDRVRQRVRDERRQQHRAAANLRADVAQRRRVVARERKVAECRGQDGGRDLRRGCRDHRCHDVRIVHFGEQPLQRDADHRRQRQPQRGEQPGPQACPPFSRIGASEGVGARRRGFGLFHVRWLASPLDHSAFEQSAELAQPARGGNGRQGPSSPNSWQHSFQERSTSS
jgi:hypothetical protein